MVHVPFVFVYFYYQWSPGKLYSKLCVIIFFEAINVKKILRSRTYDTYDTGPNLCTYLRSSSSSRSKCEESICVLLFWLFVICILLSQLHYYTLHRAITPTLTNLNDESHCIQNSSKLGGNNSSIPPRDRSVEISHIIVPLRASKEWQALSNICLNNTCCMKGMYNV